MKLFALLSVVSFVSAAQLPTNNYLPPPHNAASAGGANFLQTPSRPSNQYLAPGQTQFNQAGQPHAFSHGTFASQSSHSGPTGQQTQSQYQYSQQQPQYQPQQQTYHAHQSQQPSGPVIPILSYENVNNGDGSYHFSYATGNGIMAQEQGHLNNPGSENAEQVVQGSYSYTGDDGQKYEISYTADSNGFQPVGAHLPTPPPQPQEILQAAAEHAAAHQKATAQAAQSGYQQQGNYGGGQYQQNQGAYSAPQGNFAHAQHHSSSSAPQNQYIPPNKPSFNSQTGYQY